jgi:hypothetical protein
LGCAIDISPCYLPVRVHEDAETVVEAVRTALPRRMAVRVAALARIGARPEWIAGVTACLPREWAKSNQHGRRAKSEVCRKVVVRGAGGTRHKVEVRWCPVTYDPDPHLLEATRRFYLEWWEALAAVADQLQRAGTLRRWRLTQEMPPPAPWLGR